MMGQSAFTYNSVDIIQNEIVLKEILRIKKGFINSHIFQELLYFLYSNMNKKHPNQFKYKILK